MLYVVATPIGNLSDISDRCLEVLKEADLILCEDTRVTGKLKNKFDIETSLLSYHHHSDDEKKLKIIKHLKEGKTLALTVDSGTPGIADPAGKLIKFIRESELEVDISPVPGPSALTAAASVSGFYMNRFVFLGFPPKKNKRKKFFKEVLSYDYPVVFYESRYRVLKSLKEISELGGNPEVMVGRELTKYYETIYRGKLEKVIADLEAEDNLKGEFTIIINKDYEQG